MQMEKTYHNPKYKYINSMVYHDEGKSIHQVNSFEQDKVNLFAGKSGKCHAACWTRWVYYVVT